jgi:pimeloyl-ACP methyl ester carboxylesterase
MKEPVLLVHSGGFTSRQWRKLSLLLAPTHVVAAPDLLGYGASGTWPAGEPFHFRQDLALLASKLESLAAPAHLVGHSYGGFLALQLALAAPEKVRSITVYEPVAFGILDEDADTAALTELGRVPLRYAPDDAGADDAWLASFVEWWNGAGAWKALPEETRASFRAVGWKLFQEVSSLTADKTDRAGYAKIAAPTLLLGGALSPSAERRVLEKLARALPHAKLQMFSEMGHMGPITHAAIVNEAIRAHVEASSGAG